VLLRREGWLVNRKRVHRLYREEGLNLRRIKRTRRHLNALRKAVATMPQRADECRTMDVVSDALFDGRRSRALTLLDTFIRESLASARRRCGCGIVPHSLPAVSADKDPL
jgi:putative transposase